MSESSNKPESSSEELYQTNLKWFAAQFPELHLQLKDYKPLSELVEEDDGWHNLKFSGQKLYEPSAQERTEGQLEAFKAEPQRIILAPPQPTSFDKYAANTMHTMLEALNKEDIEISAFVPGTQAYYVFAFGLGLGGHLEALVEESQCNCLVIVEPNLEFIAQSLYCINWPEIYGKLAEREGYLDIINRDGLDYCFERFKNIIRTLNPCSFDSTIFYEHYHNPLFQGLMQRLREDAHILLSGLGFYFDETIMLNNTYANLNRDNAYMARFSHTTMRSHPAFIVGSGPSLDHDIEWIKNNQDKAVVFSCGSAIMPLRKAGIRPDFQVELENVPELYPMLLDTIKHVDISEMHLLASTTVDARISSFFDKTSYFFRPALCSFPLFARDQDMPLHNGSPSVVNAGLALAQNFGFREFYLFGADMGSKKQGQVHSKNAWQNSDEGWEVDIRHDIPERGNFGGTVYTYQGMTWTRDELELAIKALMRGRSYFNCSDGAFIKGTVAKHARSIRFKPQNMSKEQAVQKIVDTFEPYPKEDLRKKWNDENMRTQYADYCGRLLKCLEDPDEIADKTALTKINRQLVAFQKTGKELGLSMLFRGSVWQALLALEYYLLRVDGEEQQKRAQEIYVESLTKLIRYLEQRSIEDLGHLSEREWEPIDREVEFGRELWD